jgi:tRNA (guanosine-2'-O-)-methyltransferase
MRRDAPEVVSLPVDEALPAEPSTIVRALGSFLGADRRQRIETVIAARSRSVVPVLDGLIDPHNVAAVLRSAEAFGVLQVHLLGGEPLASKRIAQGTDRWIELVRHDTAASCAGALRARGYKLYVAAMDGDVIPEQLASEPRVGVVFGAEHAGVSPEMRALSDGTYTIPMRGFVQSLNVSVAAAITLRAAMQGRAGDLEPHEREHLYARYLLASIPRAAELLAECLRRETA